MEGASISEKFVSIERVIESVAGWAWVRADVTVCRGSDN